MVGEIPKSDSISELSVLLLSNARRTYSRRSDGSGEAGASPRSAASFSAFPQASKTCCATNVSVSFAWRSVCRISRAKYRMDTTATTARTSSEVTSVNLVFRLRRIVSPRLVFFQLVVECLQADAEQLRRSRLILVRGFQSLVNQLALRIIYRGSNGESQRAQPPGSHGRSVPEIRRKMLTSDRPAVRSDCGALQHVAQLAHIARPGIGLEKVHHVRAHA